MGDTGSVWISCTECGHTSRALSVIAKRVLAERLSCPGCGSLSAPLLEATPSGEMISLSAWERARPRIHEEGAFTTFVRPEPRPAANWARSIAKLFKARHSW